MPAASLGRLWWCGICQATGARARPDTHPLFRINLWVVASIPASFAAITVTVATATAAATATTATTFTAAAAAAAAPHGEREGAE